MTNFYTNSEMTDIHFMAEQRVMLRKYHACIMQLIPIADSQIKGLAKFINAYMRPDSSNQSLVDCEQTC